MTGPPVQNFSLPSRSGGRRPFSPALDASFDAGFDTGFEADVDEADGDDLDRVRARERAYFGRIARSPTPTALQLFRFAGDEAGAPDGFVSLRRTRVPLRPMSTSSSAPALAVMGATAATAAEAAAAAAAAAAPMIAHHADAAAETEVCPASPALSVWPSPPTPPPCVDTADKLCQTGPEKKGKDAAAGQRVKHAKNNVACLQSDDSEDDDSDDHDGHPPSLARSISVRWGPRLRRVPLSEVQAADDAVRRVTAMRRERRTFWTLVAVALVGVLSCTAAITLAVAQAALQVGLEEDGGVGITGGPGSGPIWDARTLGWLVASLVVCTTAAVGLVVATSARCRRGRRSGHLRSLSGFSGFGVSSRYDRCCEQVARGGGKGTGRETVCGGGSQCSHRFSALLSSRAVGRGAAAMDGAGSVEMNEMAEITEKKRSADASEHGLLDHDRLPEGDGNASEGARHGAKRRWIPFSKMRKEATAPQPETGGGPLALSETKASVCVEDRNWAKFSQDPVQLRRYVEGLEARLASVEGMPAGHDDSDKGLPAKNDQIPNGDTTTDAPGQATNTSTGGHNDPKSNTGLRTSATMATVATATTVIVAPSPATTTTIAAAHPVMGAEEATATWSPSRSLLLPPRTPAPSVDTVSPLSSRRRRTLRASSDGGSPSLRREQTRGPSRGGMRGLRGGGGANGASTASTASTDERQPPPSVPTVVLPLPPVPSATQSSILGQLYETYAEDRSPSQRPNGPSSPQ